MGTLKVLYNISWRLNESQLTGQQAELKKVEERLLIAWFTFPLLHDKSSK